MKGPRFANMHPLFVLLHRQSHLVAHAAPAEWTQQEGKQLQSLTLAQLKQQCRELRLPVSGSKAQLQERLLSSLGRNPKQKPAAQPQEPLTLQQQAATRTSFEALKVVQLREECKRLGLSPGGKKAELIARLQQASTEHPQAAPTEHETTQAAAAAILGRELLDAG